MSERGREREKGRERERETGTAVIAFGFSLVSGYLKVKPRQRVRVCIRAVTGRCCMYMCLYVCVRLVESLFEISIKFQLK